MGHAIRLPAAAVATLLVGFLTACGAPASDPTETRLSAPLSAGTDDASSPAPVDFGGATPSCATDTDCGEQALCVDQVCHVACRESSECGAGGFCNMENDGSCFNAPGCNPPPPGTSCPMMCWGYCDYSRHP